MKIIAPILFFFAFLASCGPAESPERTKILAQISDTLLPAYREMKDLQVIQVKTLQLANSWTVNQYETPSKAELRKIVNEQYPAVKKNINALAASWPLSQKQQVDALFRIQDSCMTTVKDIMDVLNDSAAYYTEIRIQLRLALADDNNELNTNFRTAESRLQKLLGEVEPQLNMAIQQLKPATK